MNDLVELYQQMILDHKTRPRNFKTVDGANRSADGHNPLCGDEVHITLKVDDDGIVTDVGFQGVGCAISTASASMMTEAVRGKPVDEARALFTAFHALVAAEEATDVSVPLGKLQVFEGVRQFPMRVKCATLAWHTLKAALDGGERVSTE